MLNLLEMCSGFEDTVVFSAVQKEGHDWIEGLLLCAPSVTEVSERHVYLGMPEEADRLLAVWDGKSYLSLVVAGCTDPGRYKEASRLNLVVSSLPLAELHNQLFNNLHLYRQWEKQLDGVPVSDGSLGRLLGAAVSTLDFKVSLYILSPAFRLVESCVVDKSTDRIIRRLETGGFLTDAQANFLLESVLEEKKAVYRTEPVMGDNDPLGYLVIVKDTDARLPECFIKVLLRFIAAHMTKTEGFISASNRELVQLLSDIFVFMPKDVDAIHRRLQSLPYKLDQCIRFVLVAPATEDRPLWLLASELKNVFPGCNIAPYDKHVVVLLSGPNFLYHPEFDEGTFETLLKKYDAYAIISKAGRFIIRGLRTLYIQSKEMLELLPAMDITGGKRHTYFEDISEYYRVYLCASSTMEHYGHDRVIYLGHPAVTELMRYDNIHGSDMRDFVFSYITNDCSILKTAEATHLHRNTVNNRLNKIKELGIDLSDSSLRRELLFSCQVMRYAERAKHTHDRFPNTFRDS